MLRVCCFIFTSLAWSTVVHAEPIITGCDRLAANPPDPDRVTVGVAREDVDIPAAIASCRLALASHPEIARFSYQLGRVLFYDGQTEGALMAFGRAIDQDYRQAKFLVGLIMTRGYEGIPEDICRVEALWRSSAHQNHSNAQVSYVSFAMRGRFDSCSERASVADMTAFLDSAEVQLGYAGGLLVAKLRADLEN